MGRFSKRVNRDNFLPKTLLDELSIKGTIGGDEAKRLLGEACHAYIRLEDRLKSVALHTDVIKKILEGM